MMQRESLVQRAALPWLAVLLAMLLTIVLAGCGYKNSPRALRNALPSTGSGEARLRPEGLLVSWQARSRGFVESSGGIEGYLFRIDQYPVNCATCQPAASELLELPASATHREGNREYYLLPRDFSRQHHKIAMATVFGDGENRFTPVGVFRALAPEITQDLRWDVVMRPKKSPLESLLGPPEEQSAEAPLVPLANPQGGSAASNAQGFAPPDAMGLNSTQELEPQIRLYWLPRREQIETVLVAGQPPQQRERFFRVNLYARPVRAVSPDLPAGVAVDWPFTPLNAEPVSAAVFLMNPAALEQSGALGVQIALRLVDRFGNEGPLSEPVAVPFPLPRP